MTLFLIKPLESRGNPRHRRLLWDSGRGCTLLCVDPLPVAHGNNASSRIKLCQWAEKSGWPRFDDTEAHRRRGSLGLLKTPHPHHSFSLLSCQEFPRPLRSQRAKNNPDHLEARPACPHVAFVRNSKSGVSTAALRFLLRVPHRR